MSQFQVRMSTLMNAVVDNYTDVLSNVKDKDVDSWLLMSSPAPIISILVCYLIFVLKVGPKWMESRKPYNLKQILIGYNLYQVLFSIWLCTLPFRAESLYQAFTWSCQPNSASLPQALSFGAWWYFFSKVIELLDTVFFVLRKKQNQISFLHVYHHTVTCLFSWAYLKYLPGEQGVFIGIINSAVHVIMYSYYLVAGLGPQYQKYLWWKKYMTWIQLGQFCIILVYLTTLFAFDCKVSKPLSVFFVFNTTIFLVLFAKFYVKAYHKKNLKAS